MDVFALRNEGMRYLTVSVDRLKAGRFGLNATDAGCHPRLGRRPPDRARAGRLAAHAAGDPRRGFAARIPGGARTRAGGAAAGGTVELAQIADIKAEDGPIQVIRENGQRYATVLSNVRGRDLVGFVAEAKAAGQSKVSVPAAYQLEWGGQFENQQRASARLALVVPIALAAIFLLLYLTFGSVRQATLVFCNVPFATIGGIVALWLSGELLSVPASVGFIALIGIAVLNGVVLVSCINELLEDDTLTFREAVVEGASGACGP